MPSDVSEPQIPESVSLRIAHNIIHYPNNNSIKLPQEVNMPLLNQDEKTLAF